MTWTTFEKKHKQIILLKNEKYLGRDVEIVCERDRISHECRMRNVEHF
jgi:hypothetical protein